MYYSFYKTVRKQIVNNKKCFLSILEWFLKDHVTLKAGVMMQKISALHHRNNIIKK